MELNEIIHADNADKIGKYLPLSYFVDASLVVYIVVTENSVTGILYLANKGL